MYIKWNLSIYYIKYSIVKHLLSAEPGLSSVIQGLFDVPKNNLKYWQTSKSQPSFHNNASCFSFLLSVSPTSIIESARLHTCDILWLNAKVDIKRDLQDCKGS